MIMMKAAIYARVSTDGQSVNAQLAELRSVAERRGWAVAREFKDQGISGTKGRDKRPGLDHLLQAATRREFDIVAVWAIDRFGRSLAQIATNMDELQAVGCELYAHQQGMDSTTAWGKGMLQMAGIFAGIERQLILDRVRAGIRHAQSHGTKSGKPFGRPKLDASLVTAARKALKAGKGIRRVARELGIGNGTVERIRAEMMATS
jgi:DNA invertase Pin-like site-specific DNA recombinase